VSTAANERLFGRAARIATVLGKYGFTEARRDSDSPQQRARRLREALEELGPTFAKIGQILSTRPDLIPPEAVAELASLQDRVTPLTEAEVVEVMEQELGVPWEDVFARIEPEPLAAGTIAQVHRAVLEDGERVVVKVQRPTAKDDIYRDLSLLELFAQKTANREALRKVVDLPAAIEHLSDSLRRELDFKLEAENVERLRAALGDHARLGAPRVYEHLSTSRLLVLEEIQGVPLREMPAGPERRDVARQLLEFYYRQILVEGFFHADPHPGNMLWWNGRVYFLDFGMVGELTPELRGHLLLLLLAFWQEDVSFLTEVVLIMAGPQAEHADAAGLEADLGELLRRYRHASLGEIQLGPLLQEIAHSAAARGVRLPAALVLTGKALSQVQLTVAELDPELDPFSVVGRFLIRNLVSRAQAGVEPKRLFYDISKLKVRAERLIDALERITGARPGRRLQVDVRGISPIERTIRVAARRLALAVTAGSALVATGTTAAATHLATWVPITLGSIGGTFTALLLLDLLRGGRKET
jgi:ubiquinone biosynthesis protein